MRFVNLYRRYIVKNENREENCDTDFSALIKKGKGEIKVATKRITKKRRNKTEKQDE